MSSFPFTDPPTKTTLAQARSEATSQQCRLDALTAKINAAEGELAILVKQSRCAIEELERERTAVQDSLARTLGYLSPIRRLPNEILSQIFMHIFEELPCCAWVLSAVCSLWRRRVLQMHQLWSKIRIVTTPNASADTIRLWLERAGPTAPLDIEIFLHSPSSLANDTAASRHRSSSTILHGDAAWAPVTPAWVDIDLPGPPTEPVTPAAVFAQLHPYPPLLVPSTAITVPGTAVSSSALFPPPVSGQNALSLSSPPRSSVQHGKGRGSIHWGHIAIYYLAEQMHRWERFVFRFDKRFASVDALKSIIGDAPLLREFEVSCAEPGFFAANDWAWLPSSRSDVGVDISRLESLTLQHVPFKWSSPLFRNLRDLSLRALPSSPHALDRIVHILSSNPQLESLSLHIASVTEAVLPLLPIALDRLRTLNVSGHYMLSGAVECLILPSLESLTVDIDAREPVEDVISNLLIRSHNPQLVHLSIFYNAAMAHNGPLYYSTGSVVTSWNLLADLEHLKSLQIGGSPLDPLVATLDTPMDDGQDQWICPNLVSLSLRGCHTHCSEGVSKLVRMIEARNPGRGELPVSTLGVTPAQLRTLELYECAVFGQDVVSWLKGRIDDVVCTDPTIDRRRF